MIVGDQGAVIEGNEVIGFGDSDVCLRVGGGGVILEPVGVLLSWRSGVMVSRRVESTTVTIG